MIARHQRNFYKKESPALNRAIAAILLLVFSVRYVSDVTTIIASSCHAENVIYV